MVVDCPIVIIGHFSRPGRRNNGPNQFFAYLTLGLVDVNVGVVDWKSSNYNRLVAG